MASRTLDEQVMRMLGRKGSMTVQPLQSPHLSPFPMTPAALSCHCIRLWIALETSHGRQGHE